MDSKLNQTLISIVCATFNGEQKLPGLLRALKSNFENSLDSFELIFVIDGSTDNSKDMVVNFAEINPDRNIKIIENTLNLGISRSRNIGIEASNGEIIAFLDDDCRPKAEWINSLIECWQNVADTCVGVGGFVEPSEIVSFNQRYCALTNPLRPLPLIETKPNIFRRIKNYYTGQNIDFEFAEYLVGANMSFRKSALEQVGEFPPEIRFGGDDSAICGLLRDRYGLNSLSICKSLIMPHEFSSKFRDSLSRSYRYGRGSGLNFWRGRSQISFNIGPVIIDALYCIFLVTFCLSSAPADKFFLSSSIFSVAIIACYCLLVSRGNGSHELNLFERLKFGFAFLMCEILNLLGFISATLTIIRRPRTSP